MKPGRFFRYLWRANAVLIFLGTGGACLLAGGLMLSEFGCNARMRRAAEAAPAVVADPSQELYLGPVRSIEGTDMLRGELLAPGHGLGISSGGYSSETHNILFLEPRSTKAHWLLPDSARVISEEVTIWAHEQDAKTRRRVAELALVKPMSADLQLAEGVLIIFDPVGGQVTTVAEGVRTLNHASLLDADSILAVYERGRRYVRAMINVHTFKVEDVQDVSVPELR